MVRSIPPITFGQTFSPLERAILIGKSQGRDAARTAAQRGTWHHSEGIKAIPLPVLAGLVRDVKARGVIDDVASFLAWGNAVLSAWNETGAEVSRRRASLPTSAVWTS